MKRLYLFILASFIIASLFGANAAADIPYWNDLQTTGVGKEYPRTEFSVFSSREAALKGTYESSPFYHSLNGTWKFLYTDDYRDLPAGIEKPDFSTEDWSDIKVPGNWERQGFGIPIYVNHPYEFPYTRSVKPILPDVIPAGVYQRTFTIPQEWKGKEIFLNLDGAKSGLYVYINGIEVGYSENSKDRAQWRITDFLKSSSNHLVIKIMRWSTGSWLECQDFWRISGIERDVYLSAQERTSLKDFIVTPVLRESGEGLLKLRLELTNPDSHELETAFELLDAQGETVAYGISVSSDKNVNFSAKIENVKPWSAENPNLYTLIMRVENEYIPFRVGFRKFEIKDGLFFVNGQPVKFKGVNMHEHDQITGHYVSRELMLKDLELMRKHNINAIRTAHYPQPRMFYELCDELGFYVYHEANIESHGMGYNLREGGTLGNNRDFYATHLDRIVNMYERCKNYACVTILSLGNEAGNGYNMYKAYEWIEEREKAENGMNRPIVYERALLEWNTDMYVPQYPSADWLAKIGEEGCDRPVIPSEYSHAMGNSNGGISAQWKQIRLYPQLQGAFIWDWVDQGFLEKDEKGYDYWTYGGDYGENMPSDANFCCNGIVAPDRTPHPAMEEVRHAYTNILFEADDPASGKGFSITNLHYFTSLEGYEIHWFIEGDGKVLRKGKLNFTTAPQHVESFDISYKRLRFKENVDYYIRFSAVTKRNERLVPAGHEVASAQFPISLRENVTLPKMKKGDALVIDDNSGVITISNKRLEMVYDKSLCTISSLKVDGRERFTKGWGIRPNFWRAPTDNDYGNGMNKVNAYWKEASGDFKASASAVMDGNDALLKVTYSLPAGNTFEMEYRVTQNAIIHVSTRFNAVETKAGDNKALQFVPRIGVRFRLDSSNDNFVYYGRGPAENYIDRKEGSLIGLYNSSAKAEYVPYVMPQECGHHCDVRRIDFADMTILADEYMEFNALRNSIEDFDLGKQSHINDITSNIRDYVEVCLDRCQMGVGGYNSWGALPDDHAMIPANQTYDWGFTIIFP